MERGPEEIARLFGDAPDIIAVEELTKETIPQRLELEWSKNRCLLLCLLLLDANANSEARSTAVRDIEEFLADPAVFNFIADRFYVAPLPDSADLPGSIVRARDGDAWRLASVLEEIGAAQEEIARCRRSWDELPLELFGGQPDKEAMAFELVQAGAFREVVAASASEQLDVLTHLLNQSSLRHLKGSDKVLPEWILQFAQQGQPLRVEEPLRTDNQTQTVFISYANEDAAKAAELTNHLRAKGICVFEDRVRKRPTHVIVLLSNDWLKSGEVRDEFDLALAMRSRDPARSSGVQLGRDCWVESSSK